MPSKFGKQYKVPPEFPSLLKAFTREVLRAQPGDIYEFGAQYFTEMVEQELAALQAQAAAPRRLSPDELQVLLSNLFAEADVDGSGALSIAEFKTLLENADLGLGPRELKLVMMDADVNGDGEISYAEFVPLAVDLVTSMYAKMEADADKATEEDEARAAAEAHLVHGLSKDEVEQTMGMVFQNADVDNSGSLSYAEFQQCCKDADIGLTRREINTLMQQCDADGDGNISYDEFVPLCFEMLTEILKDTLMQDKHPPSKLEQGLVQAWMDEDVTREGTLDRTQLTSGLKKFIAHYELPLTKMQLHSVLAEAFDEDGLCNYQKYASRAADLITRILDVDMQMERYESLQAMQSAGTDFSVVHGMDQPSIEGLLTQEFEAVAGGSPTLQMQTVAQVLTQSQLKLSKPEVDTLLTAAQLAANGDVMWAPLATDSFYILQYLAQNAAYA